MITGKTTIKKICIITNKHISYNPRVLKEADAFYKHGYTVSVVTVNNHNGQRQFDEALMKTRSWQLKTVNFRSTISSERLNWIYLSVKQKMHGYLSMLNKSFAEKFICRGFDELLQLAIAEEADFYMAHHPETLAIAYKAARHNKVKFAFDAEDFHTGMNESNQTQKEEAIITCIENEYLPLCAYVTMASKGIGEAYEKKYTIKQSVVILNVFPKEDLTVTTVHQPVRFYWYSQSIGPNRSLELLMEAASKINFSFELHLRGSFQDEDYKQFLHGLVNDLHLGDKVIFHEPILSEDIIKDAVQFDIGLALESDVSINRNICVTNKIFSYLMSGLAIVGTDTYGQTDIFNQFKEAVVVCKKNDVDDLVEAMSCFLHHPEKLMRAKQAARLAAENRFNWEYEEELLIKNFEQTMID